MMRFLPLLVLAPLCVASAGQGVIVKQSSEDLRNSKTSEVTSYVEPNRVAIASSGDARESTFVFLADSNLMRIIDHSKKIVREMDGEDLERMMGQVNEAMAKMQEQLKNMPPEQRAMMEKMMKGRMPAMMGGESVKPVYKRGDGSAEIADRPCDWYEGYRGEELFSKLCAAEWSSFDLRPADFAVFKKMTTFLTKLAPQMADLARFGGDDWEQEQTFPGMPVENTIYMGGQPVNRTTLRSVERGSIEDAVFEAPAGYKVEKGMPQPR